MYSLEKVCTATLANGEMQVTCFWPPARYLNIIKIFKEFIALVGTHRENGALACYFEYARVRICIRLCGFLNAKYTFGFHILCRACDKSACYVLFCSCFDTADYFKQQQQHTNSEMCKTCPIFLWIPAVAFHSPLGMTLDTSEIDNRSINKYNEPNAESVQLTRLNGHLKVPATFLHTSIIRWSWSPNAPQRMEQRRRGCFDLEEVEDEGEEEEWGRSRASLTG